MNTAAIHKCERKVGTGSRDSGRARDRDVSRQEFVTLLIATRAGVGLGDATLNGRELAVASYLQDHLVPNLIGRDAGRIEDTWQFFYRGAYWRRGPVTMTAIAAVDMALWDIVAKLAEYAAVSVARRPFARWRTRLRPRQRRGHRGNSRSGGRYIEQGYKADPCTERCAGSKKNYGVTGQTRLRACGKFAADWRPSGRHRVTSRRRRKLFERLRVDHGLEIELLHDVHHRLTPIEAARLARDLEPYRLFWLEDPTPAENQAAFELIRQHSVTPIATGEVFNSIWDCKELIEKQLIDYIRTTLVHAGGITHVRRIADLAALHRVRTGFHGATDLSPVCMGAALHFDTWVPNFGIQEYMRHSDETLAVFPHDYEFRDGRLYLRRIPGPRRQLDEKLAAKYPYSPRQLPSLASRTARCGIGKNKGRG